MSIIFYKFLHLFGIFLVFIALGGVLAVTANGTTKGDNIWRKKLAVSHGVGLFLMLLSGFGMLARLEIHWPWPGWVTLKVILWLGMGGLLAMAYRKPSVGYYLALLIGVIAGYAALYKPF